MEAEVIPPNEHEQVRVAEPPARLPRTFYHPLSGAVILGIDWLAFGVELPTEFLATPIVSVLAFVITFWAVNRIQRRDGDERGPARLKALIGAVAAGVPFPVTGTIVGAAILGLSGLSRLKLRR